MHSPWSEQAGKGREWGATEAENQMQTMLSEVEAGGVGGRKAADPATRQARTGQQARRAETPVRLLAPPGGQGGATRAPETMPPAAQARGAPGPVRLPGVRRCPVSNKTAPLWPPISPR